MASSLQAALGHSSCGVSGRPLDLLSRAHDASHYLLHPQALVTPAGALDVAEVMRACTRLGAPLTFRGGGTSLSGQALSDSVLVDTRTHFQGIEVLDQGRRVRVEPGVTVRAANARLAHHQRRLGPDPASEIACTIGGVIANNSSGMQCGTELNTYRTIESMVIVLPSGTVIDSAAPEAAQSLAQLEPELHRGLIELRERIRERPSDVATLERLFALKNTMGYGLNAFLDHDDPLEILVHLMVGSEGTLGFVASAVFRTVEVLPHAATGLLVFDDLVVASRSVPDVLESGVATAELLDAASLRVAQADPGCPEQIKRLDVRRHAALLVELQSASEGGLADLRHDADRVLATLPLATSPDLTADSAERAQLWRTRKGLYSAVAGARPPGTSALLEDVAVPVASLGAICEGLDAMLGDHGYEGSVIFGHARDGNLHFMLNERFDDPGSVNRYEAFTHDMVDLVLGLGGTLKAEHGTGRIMAPFVERQYGAALTEVMRDLKHLLDPAGVLNPGSVLTDDKGAWLRNLKTTEPVEEEVDRCVECGFCEPVCPSRTLTLTPRQRIVLRRELARADAEGNTALAAELRADHEYSGLQTCAVDGMCATACPVLINTGDLVRRLRAEQSGPVAERIWSAAAGKWSAATRTASGAMTAADRLPDAVPVTLSRLGRSVAGAENVPLYDSRLGAGGPRRRPVTDPAPAAVLFGACVGTMFGGGSYAALSELCRRAGIGLRTPEDLDQLCCGTPWKSKGHRAGYERMAQRVRTAVLAASENGRLPVIADASSCTEGLAQMLVGSGVIVMDATEYVAEHVLPLLQVTAPVEAVVVHPTCSSTAVGSTSALVQIARFVSDAVTVPDAWGCCAFAGDRGLLHPELTASATGPEAAEVARLEAPTGTAYVSSNRTCEIGMTRATGEQYRHVLEVLADATR